MPELDTKSLRRLASQVDALKRAMDMTIGLPTEDFGKWNGFAHYAKTYSHLAKKYVELTSRTEVNVYDDDKMPVWANVVWHQAKNLFEQVYTDTLVLAASLNEFVDAGMVSRSEVHDLVSANLRRVVFQTPTSEKEVQNAIETLFVGRGYQKGIDYDRETGRVKFSGKEFVPDFLFAKYSLAIEVKLIKEKRKISNSIEEMCADIPAYLSAYESILFCVYDLGLVQDVSEFQSSFHDLAGVRICLIKH